MKKQTFKIGPYLFILPAFILASVFLIIPFISLIIYSFGEVNLIEGFKGFTGLSNYKELLSIEFRDTLWRTLIWVIGSLFLMVVFGLMIALLLNKSGPGIKIIRTLVILPWLIPPAFGATMWLWVTNPQYGFINSLLMKLNIIGEPIGFFSVSNAMWSVIIIRAWKGIPFMVMTLLAALKTLPQEIEESAKLDGAIGWRYLWHIVLPTIKPVLIISTILLGTWTIKIFDTVYILTQGGPYHATQIVSIEMFNRAFVESEIGVASSIGVVTMIIVLILSIFSFDRKEDG